MKNNLLILAVFQSFGMTVNQYYGLLFAIVFVLQIPIWFLKEPPAELYPHHGFFELMQELWVTLKNLTTFYLIGNKCGISMPTMCSDYNFRLSPIFDCIPQCM